MNRVCSLLGVGELEYSLRFSSLVTLGAPVLGRRRRGRGWQLAWLARLRRRFVEDVGAVDVSAQFVDVVVVIVFVVVERSARLAVRRTVLAQRRRRSQVHSCKAC